MPTLMTPGATAKAIIRNLPEKTGKSLAEWVALVKSRGPNSDREAAKWLKTQHGLGHFQAQIVADQALGKGMPEVYDDEEALLATLYAGARAHLRPLHDKVVAAGCKLGKDVRVSVCRTYVSLYRTRQFVLLRPRATGLELGLVLADPDDSERLVKLPRKPTERVTCRVLITRASEVDAQLRGWLKAAHAEA